MGSPRAMVWGHRSVFDEKTVNTHAPLVLCGVLRQNVPAIIEVQA
jgi:hypothetical protein